MDVFHIVLYLITYKYTINYRGLLDTEVLRTVEGYLDFSFLCPIPSHDIMNVPSSSFFTLNLT